MSDKNLIISSIITGFIIIGLTLVFTASGVSSGGNSTVSTDKTQATLDDIVSKHGHTSVIVFIEGSTVNFSQDRYMLKNIDVHFENKDGTVIHKHKAGITLPYFFSTIGVVLDKSCISLDTGRQYCTSSVDGKKLRIIVNGVEIKNVDSYEIQHKDKILINFGDDDEIESKFKFNNIPNLAEELL